MKPIIYAKLLVYRSDFTEVNLLLNKPQSQIGLRNFYLPVNDTLIELKTKGSENLILRYNDNRKLIFLDDVLLEPDKFRFCKKIKLFNYSYDDIGIDGATQILSDQQLQELINEFRTAKILKE